MSDMQWRVCRPDDKYIGLCNTHGSIMRGEVCEATLIQRVRDALDRYVVTPYSECSQTDALAAIRDALDGSMASAAGVTPRGTAPRFAPSTAMAMRDPYLDALEQLDQMRDRAFKAEATIRRLEAEVVNLSEELVLAKATIQRVRDAVEQNKSVIGDPGVAVIRQALDGAT